MSTVTLTSTVEAIQYDGTNADEVAEAFPDVVAKAISVDGERLYYKGPEGATVLPPLWYVTNLGVISEEGAVERYGVEPAVTVAEVPDVEETEVVDDGSDEGDVSVHGDVDADDTVVDPLSVDSDLSDDE